MSSTFSLAKRTAVAADPSGESFEFGTLAFDQTVVVPPADSSTDYTVLMLSGKTSAVLILATTLLLPRSRGQKFEDLDGDGVRDGNEPGVDGFVIQLYDAQGLLAGEQTTISMDLNSDGEIDPITEQGLYSFETLAAGDYTIRELPQDEWVQSLPAMDGELSISVANNELNSGNDFGNYQPVEIHGQKFEDLNGNGVQDPGEPGLSGWTIQLFDNFTI